MIAQNELTFESTGRFVDLGQIKLHYHVAGAGPETLIALHGSGPGATAWSNFKQNLPQYAGTYQTLLVDFPGFGKSDKPDYKEGTFTYFSRCVRELMDKLGIERAHFLGNSMGGGVALKFCLDYPARTCKLVLMGPGGAAHVLFSPEPTEGIRVLREFIASPTRENLERFVRVMVWNQDLVTPELLSERWESANDPANLAGMCRVALPDPDVARKHREAEELWRYLEKVNHEVLLVWGRDDRVIPLDAAFFALRRLRHSRLHVFARCGHWAMVEKQAEFDRLVLDFLSDGAARN